jgi:hypothetical protein
MRLRTVAAALVVLGFTSVSSSASAALITINVTGGAGIDAQTAICLTGNSCPTTPAFTLSATVPVTGTLTYDNGANTLSFALTNSAPVNFTPSPFPSIPAGQTFTGSAPVLSTPFGSGILLSSNGAGSATVPSVLPPLTVTSNTPTVTGIQCSIGTGADQCGFDLGPTGWTVQGTSAYDVFMVFNLNTSPVPEPGTVAMLLVGLLGLVIVRRRPAV